MELGKYKVIIAQLMDVIPIVSGLQKAEVFHKENNDSEDDNKKESIMELDS